VLPLANESVLICHFPERRPADFFYCDAIAISFTTAWYTAEWIRKNGRSPPPATSYPPVDMAGPGDATGKGKMILSVARFESGGSKPAGPDDRAFAGLREKIPA